MIRYKIICANNTIICEKRDNNKRSLIKEEKEFIDIVNEFIEKKYKVVFDGKNLILNGASSYIFIQDYNVVLSSTCLRRLRDDILKCILSDGYTKSSDKKSKKKKKFRDSSLLSFNDDFNGLKYFSSKKNSLFRFYLRRSLEYILLLAMTFNIMPTNSSGIGFRAKSLDRFTEIPEEYLTLYLNEISDFQVDDQSTLKLKTPRSLDNALEVEEIVEEENHDDEYREAIYNFLVKEKLTLDQFSALLTSMVEGNSHFDFTYQNELEVFLDICFREERSTEEKMLITMIRDNVTYDELDATCAGCVSESHGSGECYDDAYAVASTILNRIHDVYYVGNYGTNPYNQFIAPGQFSVYNSKDYLNYLGCRDLPGYQAAVDAFYSGESLHNWLEFRAGWVELTCKYEQFVEDGNKFIVKQKESRYQADEEFEVNRDEIMSLVLAP